MSGVRLETYSAWDRDGLASLVADVLGEFGDATDPLLDADLEAPEQRYRSIWVLKAAGSVVGSVAITPSHRGQNRRVQEERRVRRECQQSILKRE